MRRLSVLAFLMAACSGTTAATTTEASTTTQQPTTTTVTTTTTTLAPTTTVDPVLAAGDYYVESVTPSNCAGQATDAMWDQLADSEGFLYDTDWEEIQAQMLPLYQVYADELVGFIKALASYTWPEDVQADIDTLMTEVAAEAGWAQQVAEASSFDTFITLQEQERPNAAAAVLRAKLGLPTNIGAETDCESVAAAA